MLGRTKRLVRMVLTVLGVGMVMYSFVIMPVKSFWRRTHTLRNARAALDVEGHKYFIEKRDSYKPLVSERKDVYLPVNQTSDWDFLVDLPVREGEDDDSEESTEMDTALNFPAILLNPPSAPPAEWDNRLPLSAFPRIRVTNCKGKTSSGDNSHVYPCKPKRRVTANETILPTILEPSNGALLRRISQRRYDDPQIEQLVEEQLQVQMQRLARVAETCKAYSGLEEKLSVSFVWAKDRNPPLVYCPIYKSASTTWMTNFLRLEHLNDDKPETVLSQSVWDHVKFRPRFGGGHQRVFKDYPKPKTVKEKRQVFKNAVRFIVVRHPFDRLVSVYRDKIARPNPLPFRPYFQDLQKAIVGRYRPPGREDLLPSQPTFSEFVDYLIESTENLKTMNDWTTKVICWTPYWVQCGVCTSDYQVVIKVETMKSDEQLLAHVANLTEIQDGSKWENKRPGPPPDFFKTLTRSQVEALYRRYKEDFDLFGYTIDEYLRTARQV